MHLRSFIFIFLSSVWQLSAQPSFFNFATNQALDGDFSSCAAAPMITISGSTLPVFNHDVSCAEFDYIQRSPSTVKKVTTSSGHFEGTSGVPNDPFAVLTAELVSGNQISDILKFKAIGLNVGSNYKIKFRMVNIYGSPPNFASFGVRIGDYYERGTDDYPVSTDGTWATIDQTFNFCAKNDSEIITIHPFVQNHDGDDFYEVLGIDDIAISLEGACSETEDLACGNCSSFELINGQTYVLSGWVKQEMSAEQFRSVVKYAQSNIKITFLDASSTAVPGGSFSFSPEGEIIEGWEKITGEFVVPATAHDIIITLDNDTDLQVYFDDIRVHPVNGNLKSFAYDPDTHKLMAELDENNYATFYEYDKEGGLVRVKKETEKGIFTVQETRSGNKK